MSWLALLENPEALTNVFDVEPSLSGVEVVSVLIDRDGPTVTVEIALAERPSKPSARWKISGANAVSLKLQLLGVETLALVGWAAENLGTIDIRSGSSTKIEVKIDGPTTRFKCGCQWLRVASLTGYRRECAR